MHATIATVAARFTHVYSMDDMDGSEWEWDLYRNQHYQFLMAVFSRLDWVKTRACSQGFHEWRNRLRVSTQGAKGMRTFRFYNYQSAHVITKVAFLLLFCVPGFVPIQGHNRLGNARLRL